MQFSKIDKVIQNNGLYVCKMRYIVKKQFRVIIASMTSRGGLLVININSHNSWASVITHHRNPYWKLEIEHSRYLFPSENRSRLIPSRNWYTNTIWHHSSGHLFILIYRRSKYRLSLCFWLAFSHLLLPCIYFFLLSSPSKGCLEEIAL
jgi:hypothetical protein